MATIENHILTITEPTIKLDKLEFESIFPDVDADKIIIAADVLDKIIRIKGWTENSNINLFDHIEYCTGLGIKNYLCTDIAVDGMLTGPSFNLYNETLNKYPEIKIEKIAKTAIVSTNLGEIELIR